MSARMGNPPEDLLADVRPSRTEIALVNRIIEHLCGLDGGWAHKVHGSRFTSAGEPDVDACLHGRAMKVEVKLPGAEPTPVQYAAMRRWDRAGALTGWVTSMRELERLLSHLDDPEWQNPQLDRPNRGQE